MRYSGIKGRVIAGLACVLLCAGFLTPDIALAVTQKEVDEAHERLTSLGNQMYSLQSSIDEQEADLQETEDQLGQLERDMVQSEQQLGRVKEKLSKRMRSIYKAGVSNLLTLLLSSSTFDELVSNVYYADKVAEHDSKLIASVKGMQEQIETEREQMESLKSDQEESIKAMQEEADAFDSVVDEAQRYFDSLDSELKEQLAAEAAAEAEKAAEDETVTVSPASTAIANAQDKTAAEEQTSSDRDSRPQESEEQSQPAQEQPAQEQPSAPVDTSGGGNPETLPFSGNEVADAWGDPGYVNQMRAKAARYGSSTGWVCLVDNETCRVTIFVQSGGSWALAFSSTAGLGRLQGDGTYRTFTGHYTVDHKAPSYTEPPLDNYWWTCFLPCWTSNNYDINGCSMRYYPGQGYDDGQGFHSSSSFLSGHNGNAGCTCLPIDKAKWIYDHVPIGSTVVVFANYDPNP